MSALVAVIALTSPGWLALIVAGIDRRFPFLDRLADRIFP